MFKRLFWMITGIVVGASGAFWAKRRVEEAIENYLPEQVADRAAESARNLGGAVRAAAAEGREVMRATEAELRARVEDRTLAGGPDARSRRSPSRPTSTMAPTPSHRRPRR